MNQGKNGWIQIESLPLIVVLCEHFFFVNKLEATKQLFFIIEIAKVQLSTFDWLTVNAPLIFWIFFFEQETPYDYDKFIPLIQLEELKEKC